MFSIILLQSGSAIASGVILVFALLFILAFVLIMRLLGAWMLRINEVIKYQEMQIKHQRQQIERMNDIIALLEKREKE